MTRIGRAVELDVDWDFEPPDLRPLVERPQRMPEQLHRTTYYDTDDLRLWARGLILEHWRVADSEVGRWRLRSPGTECPADGSLHWTGEMGRLPGEASRILLGTVRRSELRVVAEYDTTRRRLLLTAGAGEEPWGEIYDDLITVRGGSNEGLRFRRISLVLQSGYPDAADSVLRCLRDSGATGADHPQLAFGLHPSAQGQRSSKPGAGRRPITVGDTIKGSLSAALNRLLDHDYRVRIDFGQVQAHDIHQMRVAARRLRSDLRTFGSSLDPVWLDHTVADLRWLGDMLGRVRDLDVLAARLDEELDQFELEGRRPDELVERLAEQRCIETGHLEAAMSSERYINLLDRLRAAARGPLPAVFDTSVRSVDVLPALVRKRWRALRRRVKRGGDRPTDRELHRMRIAAKRLRYAAEASVPAVGKRAKRTGVAAERLQTVLGELHDSVAAMEWIRRQLADPAITPGQAFAAGWLARDLALQQSHLRREWRSAWKRLEPKRNRDWLTRK
jgi:CHAD domain-containing protein